MNLGTDIAILRRPREVHARYTQEMARRRPRAARLTALWREYCDAARSADAEGYSRAYCAAGRAAAQVLPYALSLDEDRGRTPYFYRKEAITWARQARSASPLLHRAACVRLAKHYLESYREALRKWRQE